MVPMTLISFIDDRPPAPTGVAMTFMWTTVSTVGRRDHLGDDRVADVGPHELGAAEVSFGRNDVDTDDPLDVGVLLEELRQPAAEVARDPGDQDDCGAIRTSGAAALLLVAALDAGLAQQLAVLLLRHPLAALLDDRAHECSLSSIQGKRR